MGGADAPAPSLFTCPQLSHQGDLLSITNCPLRWRPRALRAFPRGSANASPNSARARSGTPGLRSAALTSSPAQPKMPTRVGSLRMIGQTLGHYRILEKVGSGGMGVVYRARDEQLERDVALKVLPSGTLSNDASRRHFRNEALALAKLNHPNIETVYEFDTQDGTDFLVMEYVPGKTLADHLIGGALPEKEVIALGMQIAAALAEAHEHGIVHRDLKPANIALTEKGQAKVLDFGLAKLLRPRDETTADNLSSTQGAAGTLPYMSPEQLRGEQVDARSDIYTIGAVLYEMATYRRAFSEF